MAAPSHTSASGVRKGGGAALAIMGLEWTGGGAHEHLITTPGPHEQYSINKIIIQHF